MTRRIASLSPTVVLAASLFALTLGVACQDPVMSGFIIACITLFPNGWKGFVHHLLRRDDGNKDASSIQHDCVRASQPAEPTQPKTEHPQDMDSYVDLLLEHGRHMLLLRQQIAESLNAEQLDRAIKAMNDDMALVPDGNVLMAQPNFESVDDAHSADMRGQVIAIQVFYLDRYPVTNRQFKRFVDAGAYEDSASWDQTMLAGVLDFVDKSGQQGPRFWSQGVFPDGLADHPVVGVSWYEAEAYARWVGKRLPNDPEWVKAGSWPVSTPGAAPQQRKYPWGSSMDGERANLWASGPGTTVPVFEYANGVSVGGVYQLIGNVWEWTTGSYGTWHSNDLKVESCDTLRSLRGGAFDTYFDSHAVCQFQSGDNPLARKHNIGFRCVLGIHDVASVAMQMRT